MRKDIYTVTKLTRQIRLLLEQELYAVWVEGEISNLKQPISGHIYFTLKDQSSQIACVLFRAQSTRLRFELKDGMQIICFGKISVYEKAGHYQLYAEMIEPQGKGAKALAFEQLKNKLQKEGLFDPAKKKHIPSFPETIGIVTSPTGAAIRDILTVLKRRFSGIRVLVRPVPVQGEAAASQISQALDELNEYKRIDVIIVARGGGSREDLGAFNEEMVARAIARSGIPVISAIGHEIDWTIADFVADLRAPTPSAAAELVIGRRDEMIQQVDAYYEKMVYVLQEKIEKLTKRVDAIGTSYVLQSPRIVLEQNVQKIEDLAKHLQSRMQHVLGSIQHTMKELITRLEGLNPLAILARGYSITKTEAGVILTQADEVQPGMRIKTYLAQGTLTSHVETIETKSSHI